MITIRKSTKADTRSCSFRDVTRDDLLKNSLVHKSDVKKGMDFFAEKLQLAGDLHDYTKISNINQLLITVKEHQSAINVVRFIQEMLKKTKK